VLIFAVSGQFSRYRPVIIRPGTYHRLGKFGDGLFPQAAAFMAGFPFGRDPAGKAYSTACTMNMITAMAFMKPVSVHAA